MRRIKVSLLGLLSSYILAQEIDDNDVPTECRSISSPVTQLTQTCDDQNNDDGGYINCVCSFNNAAILIPACEACVANYDRNDGHDNDINDLVRSCSFTTTAVSSGAAAATSTGSTNQGIVTSITDRNGHNNCVSHTRTKTTTLSDGSVVTTTRRDDDHDDSRTRIRTTTLSNGLVVTTTRRDHDGDDGRIRTRMSVAYLIT